MNRHRTYCVVVVGPITTRTGIGDLLKRRHSLAVGDIGTRDLDVNTYSVLDRTLAPSVWYLLSIV